MTDQTTAHDDAEQPASVAATCAACGDDHPLGDRKMSGITTRCPHCGDTRYSSRVLGDTTIKPTIKPDHERITDAIADINGIGDQTLQNVLDAFPTYYDFLAADKQTLTSIEGVGRTSADRIITRR